MDSSVETLASVLTAGRTSPEEGDPRRVASATLRTVKEAPRSGEVAGSSKAERAAQVTEETAARLAERLERMMNDIHGTQVKFRVERIAKGEGSLSFAVVDRESGEIIREFPPEQVKTVLDGIQSGYGLLVDESA
ncbi:MAG TPA: flagellar protein FlaG [Oligoflexia bacterium]|nr:flagellar protein FlaG [Oligoflexia bacterium]